MTGFPSADAARAAAILADFLRCGAIGSVVAGEVLRGQGVELELVNPADGRPFAVYADAGSRVVQAAMDASRPAQRQW